LRPQIACRLNRAQLHCRSDETAIVRTCCSGHSTSIHVRVAGLVRESVRNLELMTYRECAAEMHEAGIMHALGEPTVLLNTFEPNRTCALENWGGSCMTHQKPSLFVRAKALQDAPRHDRISSEYRACTSMLQCTDVRGQNTLTKKKKSPFN
jgi:hypothetical protein